MFAEERKQRITDFINRRSKATVEELCAEFDVSPATIRNDLRELEELRLLKRTHGGAISNRQVSYEPVFEDKKIENIEAKRAIGRMALDYIKNGDSVIIDTGTTTFEMVKAMADYSNVTVVTNDLQIASYLEKSHGLSIIMLGGSVRKNYHYVLGNLAAEALRELNVDKAFIAVNGVSAKRGVTTSNMDTVSIKKEFIKAADEVIVLADSSKLGQSKFFKFADLKDIDLIITDAGATRDFMTQAKKAGVDVRVVKCAKKAEL